MAHPIPGKVFAGRIHALEIPQPHWRWSTQGKECAICAGSQLLGHSACVLLGIGNVIIGGSTSAYHAQHGLWSTILVGSGIYGLFILARLLWGRKQKLPSLRIAAVGLAFGVIVSGGINAIQAATHQQAVANELRALSASERQHVLQHARRWIEQKTPAQIENLNETAKLLGYESVEEFVALNYCLPTYNGATSIPDTQ